MSTNLFKIGDRVQLGDGPCMAVIGFDADTGLVECRWCGRDGAARGDFPPAALRRFVHPSNGFGHALFDYEPSQAP